MVIPGVCFADRIVLARTLPEEGVRPPSKEETRKAEPLLPKEETSSGKGAAGKPDSTEGKKPEEEKPGEEKPTVAMGRIHPEKGIVVRAERIEAQGLLLSLTVTENGRTAVRLFAKRARAHGLELVTGQKNTPAGAWGMAIGDRGPVTIQGLVTDATALGFKVKGPLLKLDQPLPSVVLHDVYLKVERLDTDRIGLPQAKLETKREVSLASGDPVLDLGRLPGLPRLKGLTDRVNEVLARLSGVEGSEESTSDEPREPPEADPEPTRPPKPEEPTGGPEQPELSPKLPPKRPLLPPDDGGDVRERGERAVKEVVVKVKEGLDDLLSALRFVREAEKYEAEIIVERDDRQVNAKDIVEVLKLGLAPWTEVTLSAEGRDAKRAIDALTDFLKKE